MSGNLTFLKTYLDYTITYLEKLICEQDRY